MNSRPLIFPLLFALLVVASGPNPDVRGTEVAGTPVIRSVQLLDGTVVVDVQAPAGFTRLTLESRAAVSQGAWEPRAVQRTDGTAQTVTFRLPRTAAMEILRIRGDATDPLPAAFYQGTNSFIGVAGGGGSLVPPGGFDVFLRGDATSTSPEAGSSARTVVESDIWKIAGDRLYFFNQMRGLQVIDIQNPSVPRLRGTLALPAAGEQMYLLAEGGIVLLARNDCGYWGSEGQSRIVVVDPSAATPRILASLPLVGSIRESRLVGSALYVASDTYRRVQIPAKPDDGAAVSESWEWGTQLSSFDLSNPANPVAREPLWMGRYGTVVAATERFFFLASSDVGTFNQSIIRIVDISAPDGTLRLSGSIGLPGSVADKFKMNLAGDIFTVVSETFADNRQWLTRVQTYSLTNPAQPALLGRLDLGFGERLFATRFDGSRLYVVTFLRIDPLWIVDLSDPARPTISGELEVPGWSTYIQPLGDRLVAVGIETNRVAVSLFDVANPQKPALLSKVRLGENYSWSEANHDEKAFTVDTAAGLILVPYQGTTTNGYASRVQLIDLGRDTLTARGFIEHQMAPRRAAAHRDVILSLSGRELLAVDATDRDRPVVRTELVLSYAVDRLAVATDHLIEISPAEVYPAVLPPVLRTVARSNPETILAETRLATAWPIIGSATRDSFLYVLQARNLEVVWGPSGRPDGSYEPVSTNDARVLLTVLRLDQLPNLPIAGQIEAPVTESYWSNLRPLWVRPQTLVWGNDNSSSYSYYPVYYRGIETVTDAAVGSRLAAPWFWWGGMGGAALLAFDTTSPQSPRFLSETQPQPSTDQWASWSAAHQVGTQVYLSRQVSEFAEGLLAPGEKPPAPTVTYDATQRIWITNQPPIGTWLQRHYLHVVDFADPSKPTLRRPVGLPGQLQGVAPNGALLYTLSQVVDPKNWLPQWGNETLDALAYDGTAAFLVDSLPIPSHWPRPTAISGDHALLGRAAITDAQGVVSTNRLESWTVSAAGRWTLQTSIDLHSAVSTLALVDQHPVIMLNDRQIRVLPPGGLTLAPLGSATPPGCLYPTLTGAAVDPGSTLWLPASSYGVFPVPLAPNSP